ncbi:MAG: zinc/iron-chelating domain-containing protein [Desulfobacterales bacterium]|nr:MAG: zinc/iron-chelating domain-containing protein [Desulfobacterales bacterium]
MTQQHILDQLFKNYNILIQRIDAHTRSIMDNLGANIACKKGCDDCCQFLTLFPVEAFALSRAFAALSQHDRERVMSQARAGEDACPLLVDHVCMVYQARPVICRTHGFPIYLEKDGDIMVDFCTKNFKGIKEIPKSALLDIDQLNILLTAVNQNFMAHFDADLPDRIPVSDALQLWSVLDIEPIGS